jgi:hypothetical protein
MSSFANLKRNRTDLDKLTKAIEATTQTTESGSKEGNGMAVIRFLPAPAADGDDALPWVRIFSHGFQGPGGWFIDNCLTTLNEKCPVCEHNNTLWNSGIDANKDIARKQKRKLSYVANILVISDPSNPQNEGQIKLFKFGKKIFDKVTEAMNPEFADEEAINPFDMWEGGNFKLKIRNVEGYRNYDKSEFASKSALFDGDDEKLEALWKKEYGLKDLADKKQFKSYEQLKGRLDKVLGFDGAVAAPKTKAADTVVSSFKEEDLSVMDKVSETSDDDLDYFKSLAEE